MLLRHVSGRYKVIDLLGQGSLGAVYLCWDQDAKRQVAVKVLNREAGRETFDIFEREYTMLRNLRHPNIVEVHDIGQDRGVPYITMEHVQGRSFLRYGFTSFEEHGRLLSQLLRALSHAHERDIVHRDVKDSNVMVEVRPSTADKVKLLDFNFATRAPGNDRCGTFEYMAPEVLLPELFLARGETVDLRADLYSVGVLSYLALTRGTYPGGGAEPRSGADIAEAMKLDRNVRLVSALNPDVPPALESFVMRLLSRRREGRPRTAAQALEELRRIFPAIEADSLHSPGQSDRYPYVDAAGLVAAALRHHEEKRSGVVVIGANRRLGRTRSLEELGPQLARLGTEVVSCAYTETGDPSRGPLQRIATRLESIHPEEAPELRARFPGLFGGAGPQAGEVAGRLDDQLASLLESEVTRRPVAVLLDDAHWADPSFGVLLSAARRLARAATASGSYFLLVITRSRDVPAARAAQLDAMLEESGLPLTAVELAPLRAEQIRAWLDSIGSWERPDELVRLLEERGGGIPGLMDEMLRDMVSARVVEASGGRWRVSTGRLADFRTRAQGEDRDFLGRLASLPMEAANVLQVMAAFDRPVAVDELQAVAAMPAESVEDALRELLAGGYVQKIEYQFRIADASRRGQVYAAIEPASHRETLHLRIAECLQQRYRTALPEKLDEIARHLVRSSDRAAAVDFATRAARRFAGQGLALYALPRYADAIALLERDGCDAGKLLVQLHVELAQCIVLALEPEQAIARSREHLERAGALLHEIDDPVLSSRWASVSAEALSYGWRHVDGEQPDEIDGCRRMLEEHVARLSDVPGDEAAALRVQMLRQLAYVCRRQRRFDDAINLLEQGLSLARAQGGSGASRLLSQMAFCLSMSGNPTRAVAAGQEALVEAEREHDRIAAADAHKELGLALTIDARPGLAREHYRKAASTAEPWILGSKLPEIWQNHADLLSELCQSTEAMELAGKVLEFYPDGAGSLVARAHLVMGKALYRVCRYAQAESELAIAMQYGLKRSQHGRDLAFCLQPRAYLGRIKVERGDYDGGIAMLRDVVDAVELRERGRTNRHEFVLDCLLSIGKALARRGWVERLRGESLAATGNELARVCAQIASIYAGESPVAVTLLACARAMTGERDAWEAAAATLDAIKTGAMDYIVADTAFHAALACLLAGQPRRAEELLGAALEALRDIQVIDLDVSVQALMMFSLLEQGRTQPALRFKKAFLQRMQEVLGHLDSEAAGMEFLDEPFRAEARRQGKGVRS